MGNILEKLEHNMEGTDLESSDDESIVIKQQTEKVNKNKKEKM
jgi:hypothetical protein